jgi:hypothetical protein
MSEDAMRTQSILHTCLTAGFMLSTLLMVLAATRHATVQNHEKASPLVVRVAVFAADQGTLHDHQEWIENHLFPALRTTPGHAGTFLARDAFSVEVVSAALASRRLAQYLRIRSLTDFLSAADTVRRRRDGVGSS